VRGGRRTYAITDAGRADLRDWLTHPPAAYDVRNEFVLRLFFVSTLHPDEARGCFVPSPTRTPGELAVLGEAVEKSDAEVAPLPLPVPGRLAAEYRL
jgi:hypothetical protein